MGLDIRPARLDYDVESARWSYSGFRHFRRMLASDVGLDLDAMDGFGGSAEWPATSEEPLVYLLHHSDCDGDLGYEECKALAPRLREVVSKWPDDVSFAYDKRQGLYLADLMDEVIDGGAERLVFT